MKYYEKVIAGQNAQIAAYSKVQEDRKAKELREAISMVSSALTAAAGGNTCAEQRQLALTALAESTGGSGGAPPASDGSMNSTEQTDSRRPTVGRQGIVEIQGNSQCAKYFIVSETQETRTSAKQFSFGIQNTSNFPVYISRNWYFNDVEAQSIDYSNQLKRGSSSRPIFGPGDKIEAIPFRIATQRQFHAKIHSVCPTEAEATRSTGKQIALVSQGARGMCIVQIVDQSGVRSAQ